MAFRPTSRSLITVWPSGANREVMMCPRRNVNCSNVAGEALLTGRPRYAAPLTAIKQGRSRRSENPPSPPRRASGRLCYDISARRSRQPAQRERQIPRRLKPLIALFLEAVLNDVRQRRRNPCRRAAQQRRVVLEDGAQRLDRTVTLECPMPADHFIEHRAEAENVAAMIRQLAAHLLG